ncbi:LysR substrate-binding domain-containing protein [Lachnospiraceae bacterium 62-35]
MIKEIRQSIVEMNGGKKGLLRIGSPNSYVRYVLPDMIQQFGQQYPNIRLEIVTDLSNKLLKQVESRQLNASAVAIFPPT